jgi:hypothetical protein
MERHQQLSYDRPSQLDTRDFALHWETNLPVHVLATRNFQDSLGDNNFRPPSSASVTRQGVVACLGVLIRVRHI